jgi:MFS family permease
MADKAQTPYGSPNQPAAGQKTRPLHSWFIVILLMLTYACSFIDRQIMNLLAPGIARDYHLSDIEMSLLLGPSFAILFGITGFWFGRIADRANRMRLIRYGVTVWCILTTACGIVPSFGLLFMARMGVGIGEATIAPSGVSIISDLFNPDKRARPLAIFSMGTNVGSAASYLVGAAVIPTVPVILPLLGLTQPWQAAFIYVGLPGLLFAALAMLVKEPRRRERLPAHSSLERRFLYERSGVLITLLGGSVMLGTLGYGTGAWLPTFFARTYGWSTGRIGIAVGSIILTAGISATFLSSWMARYQRRKGRIDATLRTMRMGSALIVIPSILAWQAHTPYIALSLYTVQFFAMAFATCLVSTAVCDITPNEWRATVFAIYLLVTTLFGLGFGPTGIAFIGRLFFKGDLGNALSTFTAITTLTALGLWTIGGPYFRKAAIAGMAWQKTS